MTLIETKTTEYARNWEAESSKVVLTNGEIHEVFDSNGQLSMF